jgi:hypothetical protein
MKHATAFALLTLFSAPLLAQSAPPQPGDKHWQRVENLVPGETLSIRDKASGVNTACLLDYANDTVLACHAANPYAPQPRLVYQREQIARVWVERTEPGPGPFMIPSMIGSAIFGAGVGAIMGGPLGAAFGLFFGALTGATFDWHNPNHPVVRKHRIYAS